ncbi:hypothetical protein [Streptomyces radiopugnans]|uniref:hypothetical protein n=1 Tax=Streptomyces radiopugnans TaxID=403935 RepID=UPI003F1CAEA6
MSDDEPPHNVVQLPRIGALPPPEAPPAPVLTPDEPEPAQGPEHVRISAFDRPPVAVAPSPERAAAAFRSEGTDPGPGDAGPPRTGALSMAAVLAIALAAFEGIRTWVQEASPRRAEAAKHQRELELLAAKAEADAARYAAQADSERAKAHRNRTIQPAHEYGKNTLQRRSGGAGQRSGPGGPAGPRKSSNGPHSASGSPGRNPGARNTSGQTSGPRASGGGGGSGRQGNGGGGGWFSRLKGSGRGGGKPDSSGGGSGAGGGKSGSSGGGSGSSGGGFGRSSKVSGAAGGGKPGAAGGKGSGKSGSKSGSSGDGRKVAPQAVRDAVRQALKKPLKTFQSKKDKPKPPKQPKGGVNRTMPGETGASTTGTGASTTGASGDGQTTFWQVVGETLTGRWKQRRHTPPYAKVPPRAKKAGRGAGPKTKAKHNKARQDTGGGAQGSAWQFRSSPWDTPGPEPDEGPLKAASVRLDGGPGSQEKPHWQPDAVTAGQRALPRTGPAALPRAPQRPAGQRPGTTRRKEAIPMEPVQPAAATLTAPGGMAARHATEVTVDDVLAALAALTTQGMETHDDSAELAQAARRLLAELEAMAADLAEHHNVTGARTTTALQHLVETVTHLMVEAEQMARAALDAAELAEAEEAAMGRDYRPMADKTADAGLATPSARLHNDN